jgi:hypothetical protein
MIAETTLGPMREDALLVIPNNPKNTVFKRPINILTFAQGIIKTTYSLRSPVESGPTS